MASHLGSFREYGAGTWPDFWLVVGLADFHVIWEDAFFSYSLSLLSALSLINFSGLFSHQVKFYSFVYTQDFHPGSLCKCKHSNFL